MEPENLQSVLQEAGIQVDMKNLQNPTEDFMVYLISEYLNKFNFDICEISKSTIEQLECLSCPDSASDAIKVINLYSALSSVCNEIFLKDLCLTDITSPGPKKARRQIKILFNFFAYVRNKMVENELAFVELDNQKKDMEDLIDKKNSVIAKIGATIHDRENKLDLKQQLQQEIDNIYLEIEKDNEISKKLEYQVKDFMMEHQDTSKKCNDLKAKAVKLHKVTTELQSKIVKSPEEYAARSKELKKLLEIKKEERQVLHDSITRKKLQIKNNDNAQELVQDLNNIFSININDTCEQLKITSDTLESIQKEIDQLKAEIKKWGNVENKPACTDLDNENLKGHEQLLSELDSQCIQKEKEYHSQKLFLQQLKTDVNEKRTLLENEKKNILIAEKENLELVNQYKDDFESVITEELTLRDTIKNIINC